MKNGLNQKSSSVINPQKAYDRGARAAKKRRPKMVWLYCDATLRRAYIEGYESVHHENAA